MEMREWAKREVEIACKKERGDAPDDEWDYGVACYESALKAFNSLLEDEHSGFSIGITRNILNRLIECKPLTPIEDTPDIWNKCHGFDKAEEEGYEVYQCSRCSALFKDVYADGRVRYHYNDRCVSIDSNGTSWHSGLVNRVMESILGPITMPYMPYTTKVYTDTYLYDTKNGDFDTYAIHYYIDEEGNKIDVNRYFKEAPEGVETPIDGWIEITEEEYIIRKDTDLARRAENKSNEVIGD